MNRMSLLSRRLGRFAAFFSAATFAVLLYGFYASSKGEAVSFLAAPASVCFFAALLLWMAHGFAWALIADKPAGARRPADSMSPAEATSAVEPIAPAVPVRQAQTRSSEEPLSIAPPRRTPPAEEPMPQVTMKAAEPPKPLETTSPEETMKPIEFSEPPVPPPDSPNARYTITGRRIL